MNYNDKLWYYLKNKNLIVIFFHSTKKPLNFKSYKVPKVDYLPFPSSSGNLLYTFCNYSEILTFLEQWPKSCTLISMWSGKNFTWIRPTDYSLLNTENIFSNQFKLFKIYYNLLFIK